MMLFTRVSLTAMLVEALLLTGCGKTDDQPTRFNRTLGDTPTGAPVSTGSIDTGILQDPASYKPTAYTSLDGESPGGAAAGAEGAEVEAIRSVISNLLQAIPELDFQTMLDSFVPAQVAALAGQDEYLDNLDALKDATKAYFVMASEKATGPEAERMAQVETLLPELMESVKNAFSISVIDEETAVATFHLDRLQISDEFKAMVADGMQAAAAMAAQTSGAAPGAPPGADTATETLTPDILDNLPSVTIPLPFRKVDDAWRLELPFTLGEQHAELIDEGAVLIKDFMTEITQTLGQAESLDQQAAAQMATQVAMRHMGPIMGWFTRAQLAFASLIEDQQQPEEEPAEAQAEEAEPEESEEASEEDTGERRGRRPSRRP